MKKIFLPLILLPGALTVPPVNRVVFGQQRRISEILYFTTALPDGGEAWKK